jgi:hypothetical protein
VSEFRVGRGHVDPLAVVKMHDRGRRDGSMLFFRLASECGFDEHADAHKPRVPHFNANLGGANARIEDGADIANRPFQYLAGIGVEADLGGVADSDIRQVVLIHVADDPDVGQVGDRERVCAQALNPGGTYAAEQLEVLGCGFDIDLGFVLGIFRDLEIRQGDGAGELPSASRILTLL